MNCRYPPLKCTSRCPCFPCFTLTLVEKNLSTFDFYSGTIAAVSPDHKFWKDEGPTTRGTVWLATNHLLAISEVQLVKTFIVVHLVDMDTVRRSWLKQRKGRLHTDGPFSNGHYSCCTGACQDEDALPAAYIQTGKPVKEALPPTVPSGGWLCIHTGF